MTEHDDHTTEDTAAEDTGAATDAAEDTGAATDTADTGTEDADAGDDETAETFPRTYVEKLRRESQRHRERAAEADGLARRLHTALTAATGKLADPSDLPFDAAHLADDDALAAAVDDLIARKPHLARRRFGGDVGQGAGSSADTVDLAGLLRSRV